MPSNCTHQSSGLFLTLQMALPTVSDAPASLCRPGSEAALRGGHDWPKPGCRSCRDAPTASGGVPAPWPGSALPPAWRHAAGVQGQPSGVSSPDHAPSGKLGPTTRPTSAVPALEACSPQLHTARAGLGLAEDPLCFPPTPSLTINTVSYPNYTHTHTYARTRLPPAAEVADAAVRRARDPSF